MSVQKEPSGRRSVQVEVEVPGTPEEVWRAIATGPGVTCWFVPAESDEHQGGTVTLHFGPGMDSKATITAWEPPHRFAAEGTGWGPNSPPVATEWTVEARSGGTCLVRVVHSLFASTDDWDNQLTDTESGWPTFFRILRLYLAQFRGLKSSPVQAMAMAAEPVEQAWKKLLTALELDNAKQGERRAIQLPGLPRLSGSVEQPPDAKHTVIFRLEVPVPGILLAMAHDCHGPTMTALTLYLYGDGAAAVAARAEAAWGKWIGGLSPAPGESTHVA
jgi:uncharacterized protein YndB with AHSA1/START domain